MASLETVLTTGQSLSLRARLLADILRDDFDDPAAVAALSANVTAEQIEPFIDAQWGQYRKAPDVDSDGDPDPSLPIQKAEFFMTIVRRFIRENKKAYEASSAAAAARQAAIDAAEANEDL